MRIRFPLQTNTGSNCFQKLAVCLLPLLQVWVGSTLADEPNAAFENQIRPVFVETCFRCHGDAKVAGELRVDSRESLLTGGDSGAAMVPGSPESSLLIKAIKRHADVSAMPPDADKALRPEQVAAFEKWIRDGAHWPATFKKFESSKHWAFEPISAPLPPRSSPSESPIDAFIRSKQRAVGVDHASPADKTTLIRRATLDLTGLPPTPEEVAAFEQDSSPTAYAKLIDRLLDSDEYGRHWARHWLDVVRYADTAGETADYPVPLAWRYRNYVIDAFNADKPYDQFIQEQIAGDVLAAQSTGNKSTGSYAEQIVATGYLAISRRFGFDSENYHHLTIQDTIDNLGQTVLGLSLGCARCHDHKFDPVSMQDYYGLYAIFDSTRYSFPGSEQKQKVRSMVPLLPPSDAIPKWRAFDQRVANLATSLEKCKQPISTAILRSLHDMDGDFEMQAPAAGGSNGVLVPPWMYEGKIAVTNAAQSPFKNLYARGKVGASIAADAGPYRIAQALYPRRHRDNCRELNLNLDFRVAPNSNATGVHRVWVGSIPNTPAFTLQIAADSVTLNYGEKSTLIGKVTTNEWHNLQLHLDFADGRIITSLAAGNYFNQVNHEAASASNQPNAIDFVVLESAGDPASAIEFDNLGVQQESIPPATLNLSSSEVEEPNVGEAELRRQLSELVGMGGDFEFQTEGQPPDKPWNPGPNSVVKLASRAQSSLTNLFPLGRLGVHMPNRAEYDGFGLTLSKFWTNQVAERLYATFDFRIADVAAGADGSWRFYIGHGAGSSAAVELFFNGKQLFQPSKDAREPIHSVSPGQWNQVQLTLDLKSKTYNGSFRTDDDIATFQGEFATGWDGSIDYSFIDSYGHIGGVRPAIDVDNYEIREVPFETLGIQGGTSKIAEAAARQERAITLKREIAERKAKTQKDAQELNRLLVEGPFEMAYGVSEGTPHNGRVHLRGEPSQLGDEVPRGFIKVLGNDTLPQNTAGSGRVELAKWLTRPDNPLTARVMVNRIWQYHFGQGLVKTPNDFGVRGLPPTHAELLDYLALEFMRNGWSIKSMHRLIMLSSTYQQSASPTPTQIESNPVSVDTHNLYTQFRRRRLSAEEIRDSILSISGELDRAPAKEHPFPSPIDWGYTQHGPFTAIYDHNKRSIYLMTQRLKRHPFLALFDGADPNSTTAVRMGTTVPTQALYFLNDPFIYSKSDAWARRLFEQFEWTSDRIESAYATALARWPTPSELSSASEFIECYKAELATVAKENVEVTSLAALLRTLFASNEFLHID